MFMFKKHHETLHPLQNYDRFINYAYINLWDVSENIYS